MNKLNRERQAQVVKALCEGNSIRSTARMTGVAINTVVKLLTRPTVSFSPCGPSTNNTLVTLLAKGNTPFLALRRRAPLYQDCRLVSF